MGSITHRRTEREHAFRPIADTVTEVNDPMAAATAFMRDPIAFPELKSAPARLQRRLPRL